MPANVTYKGNLLTSVADNQAKVLKTKGTYLEDDITIASEPSNIRDLIWQDQEGYIHLSPEGNVTPSTPNKWERPSEWPDLSKMDVSGGDILYMTSYADEDKGFCSFYVYCTGSYTVEVGTISGTTFTADSTQTYASGSTCALYYGSANGTFKVLRVTGTAITKLNVNAGSTVTINTFNGYTSNQGIIDIVGKLPSCNSLNCGSQYNLVNIAISDVVLSGLQNSIFNGCYSLISIDVSDWDTSAVTNMSSMFSSCYSLISIDVSNWDTSAVTNMNSMFNNCNSLTSIDVSGFDTSSVTNMSSMFSSCYSLTSIDVSNWDTSAVTNMNYMFNYCYSLTSIDVSGFDTSAVTNMGSMFSGCNSLTLVDASGFDTSAVTNMSYMFYYCCSLTSIDVSGFDTSAVTNMSYMFGYCNSLTSIDVSDWDTSAVTNMSYMFYCCYSLPSIDVSKWETSAVTNMSYMFYCCYLLTSIDVSDWDFSLIITASNAANIFRNCHGLRTLTLPSTMTMIGSYCFGTMRSVTEWHFKATTVPTLSNTNAFDNMTDFGGKKIYVPSAKLSAYQTAENWSTYASYMVGE